MNLERKLPEKTKRLFERYLSAMANFYGRITIDEAFGIIQFQNDASYCLDDFVAFIADKNQKCRANTISDDRFVIMTADDVGIDKLGEIEIAARVLSELPDKHTEIKLAQACYNRYIPKKADLLRYASPEYYEETAELRETVDWILSHPQPGRGNRPGRSRQ